MAYSSSSPVISLRASVVALDRLHRLLRGGLGGKVDRSAGVLQGDGYAAESLPHLRPGGLPSRGGQGGGGQRVHLKHGRGLRLLHDDLQTVRRLRLLHGRGVRRFRRVWLPLRQTEKGGAVFVIGDVALHGQGAQRRYNNTHQKHGQGGLSL